MVYETWLLVTCSPLLPANLWIYQSRNVSLKPIPIFLLFFFNFQTFIIVMPHYQRHYGFLWLLSLFALSLMRWDWGGLVVWWFLYSAELTVHEVPASDVIWPSSRCRCKSPTHAASYVSQRSFHFIDKQCRSLLYLKRLISEDIAQLFTPEVSTTSTSLQFHWHCYQCILFATC